MSEPAEFAEPTRQRLSPEGYETILRNVHDAVYTLDPDGRITWVNEVAFDEFDIGYRRDELIGEYVTKILSEDDISKCVDVITDLVKRDDRDSARVEISVHPKSGREIPCDLRLTLLPTDNGEFQGTIGVLRDISDRQRREQAQMVLNRVLRHNLRNKLQVVKGGAESLIEESSPAAGSNAETIVETSEELLQLSDKARRVDEVLTAEEWSLQPVDVAALVDQRCDEFQSRFPTAEISVNSTPPVRVYANDQLGFVIDNLLENAIEHATQSSPAIEVTVTGNPDDDWVEIRIDDDGPPIPEMEIEVLELEEETALKHGSGLGLWVVKWLVDRFEGQLGFEQSGPQGNTVLVRLQPAYAD